MDTKPKYRVLLFDLSITGHHGFHISCIAKYLCNHDYEIHFMTLNENADLNISQEHPNFKQVPVNRIKYCPHETIIKNTFRMILFFNRCMTYAKEWKADIIHIMYLDHNIIPLFILHFLGRCRGNYHIVGTLYWPFFSDAIAATQPIVKKLYRYINRLLLKNLIYGKTLTAFFLYSSINRQHTIDSLRLGPPWEKRIIHILEPAVLSYDICSRNEARGRLGLPLEPTILLFFGVLTRDKGFDILLEAVKSYEKDFTLLIAGRAVDFDLPFIKNLTRQNDFGVEVIARVEHIPEEEVPFYFLSSDAAVLPYKKHYIVTSGVLQQSCGAGRPVIAADVGETGKAVKQYKLGILVKPESVADLKKGINQYIKMDQETKDYFAQNALNYARKFDWRKSSQEIEDIYSNIIQGKLN
jgi:glycosyltransferase involved in cell wall biosynthesis